MHIDRAESLVASLDEIEREEMFLSLLSFHLWIFVQEIA